MNSEIKRWQSLSTYNPEPDSISIIKQNRPHLAHKIKEKIKKDLQI
jgi:hypothetical protein